MFDALVQQAAERLAVEGEDTPESRAVNATLRNLVAQKEAATGQTSPMMTREQLKAYADSLKSEPVVVQQNQPQQNTVTNPVTSNKNGYTGYIPSASAAPIKPQPQVAQATQQKRVEDEMTPEMKALLARADRVITNGSRYLEK